MEKRFAALARASERIFGARSLEDTLHLATEEARNIIGAHQSAVSVTGSGGRAQSIRAVSLSDKYAAWRGCDAQPPGAGIVEALCAEKRAMRLTQAELEAHPAWRGFGAAGARHPPMRGWLAAPLIGRTGGNLGLAQLSDKYDGDFDGEDEAVLVQLARLVSLAVENMRLLDAAQAAKRADERYRTIVETTNEGIWILDANAVTTFVNRRMVEMLGHATTQELMGRSVYDFHLREDVPDIEGRWAQRQDGIAEQREARFVRRDGTWFWALINAEPLTDAAGGFAGSIGMISDITGRKQAEAALRESEERFRRFARLGSDWHWETDAEHRITYHNGPAPIAADFALGKRLWEFGDVDPGRPEWKRYRRWLALREPFRNFEYTIRDRDGAMRHLAASGEPFYDPQGRFLGYRCASTDITARRTAEAHLKAGEDRFRDLAEIGSDWLWETDAEHRFTALDGRLAEIPGSVVGRTRWDIVGADMSDPHWRGHIEDIALRKPFRKFEYTHRNAAGRTRHIRVNGNPVYDGDGAFVGYRGASYDVTAQREAEALARASEERFRDFAEIASDWLWETDAAFRLTAISGKPLQPGVDPVGQTIWEIAGTSPDSPEWRDHVALLRAHRPFRRHAYKVIGAGGETHHFHSSGKPRFDAAGNFLGYRGTTTDLTRQRDAEAAARASELKFQRIVETANEGIWITDTDARITFTNPRLDEMLGYAPGELIGKSVLDTVPADRAAEVRAHMSRVRAEQDGRFEGRHLRKDGSEVWLLISVSSNYDDDGDYSGSTVMFVDITEGRRAQAALAESERQLRAALEQNRDILASISDGFVALDNDWRFTFVNEAAEKIWKVRGADLIGRRMFDALNVSADNPFQLCYDESKRAGEPTAFSAYSRLFGCWLEARGYPHAAGYTVFFHDVTDERAAHRALIESTRALEAAREMNQRLFETSPDIICIADRKGCLLHVNPGAAAQFGYPAAELIGSDGARLIHPDDREAMRMALRDARKSRAKTSFENRTVRRDGSVFPMNWSVAWSEAERKYYFIGRDMTERVRTEERMRGAQRLQAIGQLTGGIAHDFNNLLTVIMGNCEMLARGLADRERLRRQAELSLAASRRAAELTAQLLAFSRRQALAPDAVDPGSLLAGIRGLLERTLGTRGTIELVLDAVPWRCRADPAQLETALVNLVLNARDAMAKGGRLTISTSKRSLAPGNPQDLAEGDYVAIDVADTGDGMAPDVLARAFEPFFTTRDIGKGSGLGLAMVYGFVKQSGGHVGIASEPGRGTTVTLTLPRAPGEEAEPAA